MRHRRGWQLIFSVALLFSILGALSAPTQRLQAAPSENGARFFEQTGHAVHGRFRSFWERNGGLHIFGYPLTREFPQDGRTTQYFERAVFQLFPDQAGTPYEVQLMLLGSLLTAGRQEEAAFQPSPETTDTGNVRYIKETRHRVENQFRTYWQNNGGLAVFGFPISEEFEEQNPVDGKTYTVQYFERARFEYHPEYRGTRDEVQLGLLGVQYAQARGLPAEVTARESAPEATRPATRFPPPGQVSLANPVQVVVNDSFISPLVERFGDISIGKHVFITANTVIRADPGARVCIGHETNLQDNILFLALHNVSAPAAECGPLSSSTDEQVSIAHQAVIKNSKVGKFTFVGFRARLENVVLEDGAFVLHGATIANVRIGKDRLVPIGAVITAQEQADALPLKSEAQAEFQHEVLEVNREFAEHYSELYEEGGFEAVTGVGPAPRTSWNPNPVSPTLGLNARLAEFARIVGDVRLGSNSVVGRRTSIRADEGAPIIIGDNAVIEDRITFHALKGTSITIGKNLNTEDNIVFHGPLEVGDNLTIRDDAILFRSKVGNHVTIGAGAIVVDVTLRDGVTVPDYAVITTQEQADALP